VFDGKVYQGFVDCFDILRALLNLVDIRSLTEENREYKLRAAGAYGLLRSRCNSIATVAG
jgi:hypothetical protein